MNSPIDIKCLSVNIRGLNKTLKRHSVFRWLHRQNCSFVFLQETYSLKECENVWQAEWGGEVFFSHGTNHSKGTMILINPKIKCNVQKKICDKNGRYIILDIAVADRLVSYLSTSTLRMTLSNKSPFSKSFKDTSKNFLKKQ